MQDHPKIYITGIDSYIGKSLKQVFRSDHLHLSNQELVRGSSPGSALDFSKNSNSVLHTALNSDVIILILQKAYSEEVQAIIAYLRGVYSGQTPNVKAKRVIGVNTGFGTWANTQLPALNVKPPPTTGRVKTASQESPEQILKELNSDRKVFEINDSMLRSRLPHNLFVNEYELEEQVYALSKLPNIRATVVNAGILYGGSYDELLPLIQPVISAPLNNRQHKVRSMCSTNPVTMIHVDDLTKIIHKVALSSAANQQQCLFAVDDANLTQKQLATMILETFQQINTSMTEPEENTCSLSNSFDQQEARFNIHLKATRSRFCDDIKWASLKGLSPESLATEFKKYLQFQRTIVFINGEDSEDRSKCIQKFKTAGFKVIQKKQLISHAKQIETDASKNPSIHDLIKSEQNEFNQQMLVLQEQSKTQKKDKNVTMPPAQFKYSDNLLKKILIGMALKGSFTNLAIVNTPFTLKASDLESSLFYNVRMAANAATTDQEANIPDIRYPSAQFDRFLQKFGASTQGNLDRSEGTDPAAPKQRASLRLAVPGDQPSKTDRNLESKSCNLQQYLMDKVMPSITEAFIAIQNDRPDNIVEYFIEKLKNLGDKYGSPNNTRSNNDTSNENKTPTITMIQTPQASP